MTLPSLCLALRRALLAVPLAALLTGCFQELDTGVAKGGPVTEASDAATPTSCTPGSAQCFELCGSPSCFLPEPDAGIPTLLQASPIYNPDGEGGTSTDACAQIRFESLAIRQRSCAQCHTLLKVGGFDYVTDDQKLATQSSQNYVNPSTNMNWRMVVPGDPQSSWLYQRLTHGDMPPAPPTARALLGEEQAATVIQPTLSDQSVIYTWITDCIQGAPGTAYSIESYGAGGPYGPPLDGGTSAPADGGENGSDGG